AGGRRFFFKGLTGDRVAEALLTAKLSAELSDSFAPTVALERQNDESTWWLTEEWPGTPVAAFDGPGGGCVVGARARKQRALADPVPTLGLPPTDFQAAVQEARTLLVERRDRAEAHACLTSLASVCESMGRADVPHSWIPLDIDPGNVLVDGCHVRWIDLD